jgi:hypothetical protein
MKKGVIKINQKVRYGRKVIWSRKGEGVDIRGKGDDGIKGLLIVHWSRKEILIIKKVDK